MSMTMHELLKMSLEEFGQYFDHTRLDANATEEQITQLAEEARQYKVGAVCVNGCHVPLVHELLRNSTVKIATVIGFPLGAMTTAAKLAEAEDALRNGADELDMVLNIGALKDGRIDFVRSEIRQLADLCHRQNALLKVIIETYFLKDDQIITACQLAKEAGADFVKTSTGFAGGGALVEDVELMRKTVGSDMKIKASGGIRSLKDARDMIDAGADRLGCSATTRILKEFIREKEEFPY